MTDSPFLPRTKIQFAWDSTSLGLFKTCPRLYQYTILDGYSPLSESVHLRFGAEYHTALQEYDISRANGIPHEESIHDVISSLLPRISDWEPDRSTKAGKYKNRESLAALVVDYLDYFGPEDPATTYIKADGSPAVELSFRYEVDFGPETNQIPGEDRLDGGGYEEPYSPQPYLLCGHLDRVVSFNSQLLVMDRKTTTTTLSDSFFAQFEPNNQMTLYTAAGNVILGEPIRGVIIDAAQILLTEPNRFVRRFTYRTEDQIDEWLWDLQNILRIAEAYAEAEYWPMNDTACDKFGGCRFRQVCSKSPAVRERFLAADYVKLPEDERWNPLKPR